MLSDWNAALERDLRMLGWISDGDPIVLVAGKPLGVHGSTNTVAIHYTGDRATGFKSLLDVRLRGSPSVACAAAAAKARQPSPAGVLNERRWLAGLPAVARRGGVSPAGERRLAGRQGFEPR
jgi:hypothetical protein